MKETIIVNLFASPGSGKSTTAAGVFSKLKLKGVDCELVTEFAKDVVWEKRQHILKNQLYISGKQSQRIFRLDGQVDVVITDSPLLLSSMYNRLNGRFTPDLYESLMLEEHNRYTNINYFIELPDGSFNENGREQKYEESIEISKNIKIMLDRLGMEYYIVHKSEETIERIVDFVHNYITLQKAEDLRRVNKKKKKPFIPTFG